MTYYKHSGIWVDPSSTDEILVLLNQDELELIILALNWAVKKSETKTGAQSHRLRHLEERMRELRLQRVDLLNQLQKGKEPEDNLMSKFEVMEKLEPLLKQRPDLFEEIELEDYCTAGSLDNLNEDLLTADGELSWVTVESQDGEQMLTFRFRWADVEEFGIRRYR